MSLTFSCFNSSVTEVTKRGEGKEGRKEGREGGREGKGGGIRCVR